MVKITEGEGAVNEGRPLKYKWRKKSYLMQNLSEISKITRAVTARSQASASGFIEVGQI